jgi:hypothetical protein
MNNQRVSKNKKKVEETDLKMSVQAVNKARFAPLQLRFDPYTHSFHLLFVRIDNTPLVRPPPPGF